MAAVRVRGEVHEDRPLEVLVVVGRGEDRADAVELGVLVPEAAEGAVLEPVLAAVVEEGIVGRSRSVDEQLDRGRVAKPGKRAKSSRSASEYRVAEGGISSIPSQPLKESQRN